MSNKKKALKDSCVRLVAYVPKEVKTQITLIAMAKSVTSSEIVSAALAQFLSRNRTKLPFVE